MISLGDVVATGATVVSLVVGLSGAVAGGGVLGGGFRMGWGTCTTVAESCQCMAKTTTIL